MKRMKSTLDFEFKERYNIDDLCKIMKILRSENGCPWDKVQTHESIRKDFLEETYEAVEAIDLDNPEMLREELGDVLLQVVFHSEIESEKNSFDFEDVVNDICVKLIVRHPHVFGDTKVNSVGEVLDNWNDIKKQTKGQKSASDTLDAVCKALPALMRAEKLGKRASKAGVDYKNYDDAVKSFKELVKKLDTSENAENVIGDLLFSLANISRLKDIDAEECLTRSCDKFTENFKSCEKLIVSEGKTLDSLTINGLEAYLAESRKN